MGKRRKFWQFRAAAGSPEVGELLLYGPISGDATWFGDEVTPKQFHEDLQALGDIQELRVYINSPGGDAFAAQAIYNMLQRHKARVTIYVDGLAASAASLVAMAGDRVIMAANSMMMIHNPWIVAAGDADELRKAAEMLDQVRESMIEVYQAKTGLSRDKLARMLDDETWMTADEAVELGFADEVERAKKVAASVRGSTLVVNGVEVDLTQYQNPPKVIAMPEAQDTPVQDAIVEAGAPQAGVSPGDVSEKLAPEDTPWEEPTLSDFTDKSWDDLSDAEKRRIAQHYAWARTMPPEKFGDLKFPHHRPSDGAVVWRAVANAAARLNQADIPAEDLPKVREHLARHYRQFNRTPPWEEDDANARGRLRILDLELELVGGQKDRRMEVDSKMNREMRDIEMKLADAEQRVRFAIAEGNVEAAEKAMEEVRALRKQKAMLEELEAEARREAEASIPAGERRDREELEREYTKAFIKAIRRRPLSAEEVSIVNDYRRQVLAVMHEGGVASDPDGDASLVVPQDISTRINQLTREFADLSQYIRVEQVGTLSGSRVLEKDEDMQPLQEVEEYGQIGAIDNPKFVSIAYRLRKRAGRLPITNELLQDSDQNILNYVTEWIARKVVVTRNTLIVQLLDTLTAQALSDLDAIKRILNVDLDPAISRTAVVITNQDGFHWLDTQKDAQGRYLLQDDITRPGEKMLFGRPVVVVSNRYLPSREDTDAGKTIAPIYIGNGKQFAVWFTRGTYELASTREGGEAWYRDTTELRVITRDDLRQWDAAAMVKGELDVTPAA